MSNIFFVFPRPGNVAAWDRYAYVRNNPLRYTDPSGHFCVEIGGVITCSKDDDSRGYWYKQNPAPLMPDRNQKQILSTAIPGDRISYRMDGVNYQAEFIYQEEDTREWVLWDFRTRAPIHYRDVSLSIIGYYSYNSQTHNYDLHWGLTKYDADLPLNIFYTPGEWYVGEEYMLREEKKFTFSCDFMCKAGFVVTGAGVLISLGLVVTGPPGWIYAAGVVNSASSFLTIAAVDLECENTPRIVPVQNFFQEP